MSKITQKRLKELLEYNPETGVFTWKYRPDARKERNTRWAGKAAGYKMQTGYIFIYVNRIGDLAHRLAFLYMTGKYPKYLVDHENGIKADNSWANLRLATYSQNMSNRLEKNKNNTSGYRGVTFDRRKQLWFGQIMINRKHIFLGYCKDKEGAARTYDIAARKYFGEFARLNFPREQNCG